MHFIRRYRWAIIGVGSLAVLLAFLAFRPDKLFVDDTVDESLSDAFTTPTQTQQAPESTTTENPPSASEQSTTTTEPVTTTEQSPQATEPATITSGEFSGIDHRAEGTATVYEQDGTFVLRFEDNTDIQNGPDLFIWLLADDEYNGGTPSDYIDLGKIKGNVGGQNYELPAEFDSDTYQYVLVWCKRFAVPFAGSQLT